MRTANAIHERCSNRNITADAGLHEVAKRCCKLLIEVRLIVQTRVFERTETFNRVRENSFHQQTMIGWLLYA